MKKLLFLSATAVILSATVNAQTDAASIKKDEKSLKQQENVIKHEMKADREALRKLKGNEVSYQAKEAFYRDFGNIPVTKWERTGEFFDKATFIKDEKQMEAFYDFDAKLVGTVQDKTFADLPAKAQTFINEKYIDYNKDGVILFDDNELNSTDMVLYGTRFDDADNYFVELVKGKDKIIVKVNMEGDVSYHARMR